MLLFLLSVGAFALAYKTYQPSEIHYLLIFCAWSGVLSSLLFSGYASLRFAKAPTLTKLRQAAMEIRESLSDLETARTDQRKLRHLIKDEIGLLQERVSEGQHQLHTLFEQFQQHHDTIATLQEKLQDARIKQKELTTLLERWETASIDIFSFFERQISFTTQPEQKQLIEKALDSIIQLLRPLGVYPILPKPDTAFSQQEHQWDEGTYHLQIPQNHIIACKAWGYKTSAKRQLAKVIISLGSPPQTTQKTENEEESSEKYTPLPSTHAPSPTSSSLSLHDDDVALHTEEIYEKESLEQRQKNPLTEDESL
jgi:hypothetical protein